MSKLLFFIGCILLLVGVFNHTDAFNTNNDYYILQQTARINSALGFYIAGILCIWFGCIVHTLEEQKKRDEKTEDTVVTTESDTKKITKEDIENSEITPDMNCLKNLSTKRDIELAQIIVNRAHLAGDLPMGEYVELRDFLTKRDKELLDLERE